MSNHKNTKRLPFVFPLSFWVKYINGDTLERWNGDFSKHVPPLNKNLFQNYRSNFPFFFWNWTSCLKMPPWRLSFNFQMQFTMNLEGIWLPKNLNCAGIQHAIQPIPFEKHEKWEHQKLENSKSGPSQVSCTSAKRIQMKMQKLPIKNCWMTEKQRFPRLLLHSII